MSSAAAAALVIKAGSSSAATGVVRRSRVRSLDGITNGFRPPVSSLKPKSNLHHEARRLCRSRSMTSAQVGSGNSRSGFSTAACVSVQVNELRHGSGGGYVEVSQPFSGGGAGAGAGAGNNQLSSAAGAASALAVFAASRQDSGDGPGWANDKTGGSGKGGGGGGSMVWCREGRPGRTPLSLPSAAPSSSTIDAVNACSHALHRVESGTCEMNIPIPSASVAGSEEHKVTQNGFHARHSSSSSSNNINRSSKLDRDGGHEVEDFQTFKDIERMRGNLKGGAAAAAAMAQVSAATVAASTAVATNSGNSGVLSLTDVYQFESGREPVGRGNRSTVSTAVHRETGQHVAVKCLARSGTSRLEVMEEVNMLKLAGKHPNVVTMQAFFEDHDAYYIVMEMCQGGELFNQVAHKGRYSEGQAARIMAEVADAVGFLHRHGIVHFDLKPENIMLAVGDDSVPDVRLADFGSAFRQHRQICAARDYTLAYSAPEVLASQYVDEKVDMWALGVVMWVLLTGRHPFDATGDLTEGEMSRRVAEEEPDFKSPGVRHVSPEGKDLVRRLLAKDPDDRPSAAEMMAHPWFRAVVTRAKASSESPPRHRERRQQKQRPQLVTNVPWSVPSRRGAQEYHHHRSNPDVDGGVDSDDETQQQHRRSPPRRRRQAVDAKSPKKSTAASAVAAMASVTRGDTLSM